MSPNSSNHSLHTLFAVDRHIVADAIARGRRERSDAIWDFLRSAFGAGKSVRADRAAPLDRNATFAR